MDDRTVQNAFPLVFYEIAGFTGVLFYLGSYAALQIGLIRGAGYLYASLNLAAAALVLLSLANQFNLWSAIIQISWILISIVGVARIYYLTHRVRFSPEERAFIATWFPDLSIPDARRFLTAGNWIDTDPGAGIAEQGKDIGFLYFLTQGIADVAAGGKPVGQLVAPSVIGELTCFDGGPASATVTTAQAARLFAMDTTTLARLCKGSPDLRLHLQSGLARDTHAKLNAANQRLGA
jgi:hypothetical protein